jgi:hypothetical protein
MDVMSVGSAIGVRVRNQLQGITKIPSRRAHALESKGVLMARPVEILALVVDAAKRFDVLDGMLTRKRMTHESAETTLERLIAERDFLLQVLFDNGIRRPSTDYTDIKEAFTDLLAASHERKIVLPDAPDEALFKNRLRHDREGQQ